jgi:radical SAM protein with 4Fe4S-binding SPASM domain
VIDRSADVARVRGALQRLVADDELAFARLFDPEVPRARVLLDDGLAKELRALGLVDGQDALTGEHRIRRCGERFYFLELGSEQYRQDVWPETDAMLGELDDAPRGRFLDVGTGCGIVAIEAAARGHTVVATDLYPATVEVARYNAALNAVVGIDFRAGHLFEPVAGERFDLVLTAPHYGRTYDQLRVELLNGSLAHLTDGGRLGLSTVLEWEGERLGMESVLRRLVARGARVRVTPIRSRDTWFHFAVADEPIPRLLSRHRFLVSVTRASGEGSLEIEWPSPDDQPTRHVVPLSRLRRVGPQDGALVGADDVAVLRGWLDALGAPTAIFETPLPEQLLDGCRLGGNVCVGSRGAASAIVDVDGKVRPCTHGGAVATIDDTLASLDEKLQAQKAAVIARRGCTECSARDVCSQCLFTGPLDEASYCELIRTRAGRLDQLRRLFATVKRLGPAAEWGGPLRVARWPRRMWIVPDEAAGARLPRLADRWNAAETWTVQLGDRHSLWFMVRDELRSAEVDSEIAAIGEEVADLAEESSLKAHYGPRRLERALARLESILPIQR